MKASGDRIASAAEEVLPQVSQGLGNLDETAGTILGRLDALKANVAEFSGRLQRLTKGIETGFAAVTWIEVFVLAWLALSQVSLLSHAYRWARKP